MATLTEMEQALMARIKAGLPGLSVETFPDKPASYQLTHAKGAVLIRFHGSTYGPAAGMGFIRQGRRLEWELITVTRSLRKADAGVYSTLDQLRNLVTGYRLPDCDQMYPVAEAFLDESDGVWQYSMIVCAETINLEVFEEDEGPPLSSITLHDNFEETTEVLDATT